MKRFTVGVFHAVARSTIVRASAVLIMLALASSAWSQTLTTGFASSTASGGNVFNLQATGASDVTVNALDINLRTGVSGFVEVWVRPGSYVGFQGSIAGWTQVTRVSVASAGSDQPTPLPITTPFLIPAGATVGVYVTSAGAGGPGGNTEFRYLVSSGNPGVTVAASNADLTITEGHGVRGYFNTFFAPRIFTGNIRYSLQFDCALLTPVVGQWGVTGGRCGNFVSTATSATFESALFNGPPPVGGGYVYDVRFVSNRPRQPTAATSIIVAGSPLPLRQTAQWWDQGVYFNVANGKYSIFRYNGAAKPVPLQTWVVPIGVTFAAPPASNRMRVETQAGNLVFSINGVTVRTLPNTFGVDQFGTAFVRSLSTTGNLVTDDWMEILGVTLTGAPPEIRTPAQVSPAQQQANDAANADSRSSDSLFAPKTR